jgi:methylenetetrahydrofolate reductase (NADPH)
MQLIRDIYAAKRATGKPVVSLEFFPPKTEEGDKALLEKHIPALMAVKPDFCSVTYGAGGSTRDKTLMIVDRIQREHHLTALAHLTCVNHTREQVGELLQKIKASGCQNILALRGDPPGGGEFQVTPGGFRVFVATREIHPRAKRLQHRLRGISRGARRLQGRQACGLAASQGED